MKSFSPSGIKKRPDQTVFGMNGLAQTLESMQTSIRVLSEDGKNVIIIGAMPKNAEGKQSDFGIAAFEIKGDRLILKESITWI